jgi:hypothetical protein
VSAFQRRRARTPAEEGAAGLCGVAVGRRRREHSFDFGHRSHFCCQLRSINARQRFCTDFGVLVIHMSDKRGAFNRSMQRRTETLEASLRRKFFGPSTRHSEKWARQPDLQQRVRGRGMRGRPREVLELPKNRLEMHATHQFLRCHFIIFLSAADTSRTSSKLSFQSERHICRDCRSACHPLYPTRRLFSIADPRALLLECPVSRVGF